MARRRGHERWTLPAVLAVVVHGGLVAALELTAGEVPEETASLDPQVEMVDVEVEPPPEEEKEEEEPAPPPEPEEPEPPPEPEEPPPEVQEPPPEDPPPRQTEPPPETSEPTEGAPPSEEEPAPGPPSPEMPGGALPMDIDAPSGTVPAARGRSKRSGPGGPGEGTGGGGPPDSEGTGPPKPVSVAAIKRRAMPIGDTDFMESKDYPEEARQQKVEGTVKVKLLVDEEGKVRKRSLVKRLGHGLDQLALKLAAQLRFEPAIDQSDRPVASVVVWTFRFRLPD